MMTDLGYTLLLLQMNPVLCQTLPVQFICPFTSSATSSNYWHYVLFFEIHHSVYIMFCVCVHLSCFGTSYYASIIDDIHSGIICTHVWQYAFPFCFQLHQQTPQGIFHTRCSMSFHMGCNPYCVHFPNPLWLRIWVKHLTVVATLPSVQELAYKEVNGNRSSCYQLDLHS